MLVKSSELRNIVINNCKAINILTLALLLFLTACANDPYIKKLQDEIGQAPYSTEDYIPDVFDCSNMTNLLHDWLKQRGYDTKILVYYLKPNISHAILLVDDKVLIESVTKRIIKNKTSQDYLGALIFKDAETMLEYTPEEKWVMEWGYKQSYIMVSLPKILSAQVKHSN
jgi:hypothetical protein